MWLTAGYHRTNHPISFVGKSKAPPVPVLPTTTRRVPEPVSVGLYPIYFGIVDRRPRKYCPGSKQNQRYREEHPRNYGVIVYASSTAEKGSLELRAARQLGQALARLEKDGRQLHVITGGGNAAMRAVAQGASEEGAHTVGITMSYENERLDPTYYQEFIIHNKIAERLDGIGGFEHRGAYSIALPGGLGTFHEIFKKLEELYYDSTPYPSQRQLVLVDVNQYFSAPDGFLDFTEHMMVHQKISNPERMRSILKLVATPQDAANVLLDPTVPWTSGVR